MRLVTSYNFPFFQFFDQNVNEQLPGDLLKNLHQLICLSKSEKVKLTVLIFSIPTHAIFQYF